MFKPSESRCHLDRHFFVKVIFFWSIIYILCLGFRESISFIPLYNTEKYRSVFYVSQYIVFVEKKMLTRTY